jgi:hypothetical protein
MTSGRLKLHLFFGLMLWMLPFSSCGPKLESLVYFPVNKYISFAEYSGIGVLQTYVINGVGVNGIILFHKDVDVWEAYDMTCMYRPRSEGTRIVMDKSGWLPQCPTCKSVFNILNEGFPQSGPAQQSLHQYHVYMNGTVMQITN